MKNLTVYHGTSKKKLKSILKEGVVAPSYWTDSYEKAFEYAQSWGDPVVLKCEIGDYDFRANMLVAQALYDEDEIDDLPGEYDVEQSLEYFEGIVCHDVIKNFEVVDAP
jgi:phosphoribosylaminoimidazole carboxylase (NCAIR synthetase)